jgi:cytoskeletal protein CcmA (bactofilin family)
MSMWRKTGDRRQGSIETLVGKGTTIRGDLEFNGGLHVDGSVVGNLTAASDSGTLLSVSEAGRVEGTIKAPQVIVNGTVRGDIHALERLVLGAKARVEGDVHYGSIELELGAQVNGHLVPGKPLEQAVAA